MTKKVLCLHGYAMNGAWLNEWLSPLEDQLGGDAKFIFPTAPIESPEEEVRAMAKKFNAALPEIRIGKGKNWCWYRATDDKPPVYRNIETSLMFLAGVFQKEGPIDGLVGWSQGTVMAAILAALMLEERSMDFNFRWAILCGGFRPGDERFRHHFDASKKLELPTLHVIGDKESDFMKTQGRLLFDCFADAELLATPTGHIMPVKYPDYMDKIGAWIRKQLKNS